MDLIKTLSSTVDFFSIDIPVIGIGIIAFIGIVWITGFIAMWSQVTKINKDLKQANFILPDHGSQVTDEEMGRIGEKFAKSLSLLSETWQEFSESCVREKGKDGELYVYNTLQAEVFFSLENLIERRLQITLYEIYPGLLTSLGLLGTFICLFFGMNNLHVQASGQVTGIDGFINNLAGKFLSSIAGLLCALIFLIAEKLSLAGLRQNCFIFQERINRLFSRRNEETLLIKILGQLEQQTTSFKQFNTDLSGHLKESFRDSMGPMMDRMVTSLENLQDATEALRKQKEESSSSAITGMIGEFRKSLVESASSEFTQLNTALASAAQLNESTNTKVSEMILHFDEIMNSQKERNSEHLEETRNHFDQITTSISAANSDMTEKMHLVVSRISSEKEKMQSLFTAVDDHMKSWSELLDRSQTVSGKFESVANTFDTITQNLKTNAETSVESAKLLEQSSSSLEAGLEKYQNSLSSLQSLWVKQEELYDVLDNKLVKAVEGVNKALEEYSRATSTRLGDYLTEFDEHLSNASRKLGGTVDELDTQLSELTDILEKNLASAPKV